MATVTKPMALDESINTTEQTSRNIADVLADELANIANAIGGGSGSGGHVIQNADGTDLAQRAKLQFGGMLKATDDATNGVTKVSEREIIPEVVSLSSGCKLIRYGKFRILKADGVTPTTAGTLGTLDTGDRPSTTVRNVLGTYLPFCLGLFIIDTNGRISIQYTTSYGGTFEDVPNGTYVYGEVVWTVS